MRTAFAALHLRAADARPSSPLCHTTDPRMTTPILLLGFEPFGGDTRNPSKELLLSLDPQQLPAPAHIEIFPVVQQEVAQKLPRLLEKHQPQMILGLGLASGEAAIRLERVGLNWMDFSIPDESGKTFTDQRLDESKPDAYLSALPLRKAQQQLLEQGIPATVSYTAGTYLCNQLLFLCLDFFAQRQAPRHACFVHLPLLPAMAAAKQQEARKQLLPSMSLATQQQAFSSLVSCFWESCHTA